MIPFRITAVPVPACLFAGLVSLWVAAAAAQPTPPGLGLANPVPNFLIDLGDDLTTEECRRPSVMPTTVEEADRQFPCRQMKITQHWLAPMLDRHAFGVPADLLGTDDKTFLCLSVRGEDDPDCDTILNDTALPAEDEDDTIADIRRQAYFGRYWSNFGITDDELDFTCKNKKGKGLSPAERETREALEDFDKVIRSALLRLIALLVASENPIDRDDDPNSDDWWWELPAAYRHINDIEARRAAMRKDVNEWIKDAGIWVLADAGTPQRIDECQIAGDYDFLLIQFVHLLYIFKGHDGYLSDDAIDVILRKNLESRVHPLHIPPTWLQSAVPFSGAEFDRELWYSERAGGVG